jgi:hypothetical protein
MPGKLQEISLTGLMNEKKRSRNTISAALFSVE